MPRLTILALGFLTLALLLGAPSRLVSAAEPAKATEPAPDHATDAHGGSSEHAHHGEPDPMEVQPSLAIWTVVVFLGLFAVLAKFAWKPLLGALHQREEHLEHVLLETERARNESEQLLAQHRKEMETAADQVRALLENARREAQVLAEDLLQKARTEADAERQRARRDIENARDQALSEIWQKTADLAVSVAGRVLSKELGPDDHRRLVSAAINELPSQPVNGQGSSVA
ncbi:MAG: F0F1 ATP synthase subunit B [Isosphaeraceae bacterium]|nr:F0F1 ATP synthase subunit B [Isosphaeraceae bacterium]